MYLCYRPRSDTCKTCDSLNVRISAEEDVQAKSQLECELQLHHCKAEGAYQQLKEDIALCRTSSDVDMLTFDLQQSLPTPKLATNVAFYKRQMWTYNLGIHDCSNEKGFMYMWPESLASRGSQEVASCLFKHFCTTRSQASHLIVFSDACGGQNRNINMACFWLYVVSNPDFCYTLVDHKFMLSGHSYLPNDRDFGAIEKASRKTQHVFVPEDWCMLVERARQKNPFVAVRMATPDFISLEGVKKRIVKRKTNSQKQKVNWLDIRWIQVRKEKPFHLFYKYSLNTLESWKILDVQKRQPGRPIDIGRIELQPLYSGPRPLPSNKLDDLKILMQFIPPVYHAFYTSLDHIETEEPASETEDSDSD